MREFVTLNAKFEEHTLYLDIFIVMINNLKDKNMENLRSFDYHK